MARTAAAQRALKDGSGDVVATPTVAAILPPPTMPRGCRRCEPARTKSPALRSGAFLWSRTLRILPVRENLCGPGGSCRRRGRRVRRPAGAPAPPARRRPDERHSRRGAISAPQDPDISRQREKVPRPARSNFHAPATEQICRILPCTIASACAASVAPPAWAACWRRFSGFR
jgi:hypothetical protein